MRNIENKVNYLNLQSLRNDMIRGILKYSEIDYLTHRARNMLKYNKSKEHKRLYG